jgi:predicted small secreted protein
MEIDMKTAFVAIAFLLAASATACNTVEGVGKDAQAAGEAVEDAAKDNK